MINSKLRVIWNGQWLDYPLARQSKLFLPDCLTPLKPKLYTRSREEIGLAMRCITGHNNLAYHQSRINNSISKLCRFCNERAETFYHFFAHCPRLKWVRLASTGSTFIYDINTWTLKQMLDFANSPIIYAKLASNELYATALQGTGGAGADDTNHPADEYNLDSPSGSLQPAIMARSPSPTAIPHQFPPEDLADISDLSSVSTSS